MIIKFEDNLTIKLTDITCHISQVQLEEISISFLINKISKGQLTLVRLLLGGIHKPINHFMCG